MQALLKNVIKCFAFVLILLSVSACFENKDKDRDLNLAPDASDINLITQTETRIEGNLPASDANNDTLTYTVLTPPSLGELSISSDGTFIYTPNAEVTGQDSFSFSVSDGMASASASVNITIETLQLSFAEYSRRAFNQSPSDVPLSINGRAFIQDVSSQSDYQDLIDN